MPQPTPRPKSDRHTATLEVAAARFAANGVAATSVRDIAEDVGILSGSLYHHFSSKDKMVTELVLEWLDDVLARYKEARIPEREPSDALRTLISLSFATMDHYPHAIEIYQNDASHLAQLPRGDTISQKAARIPQLWMSVIEQGVSQGDFRDDVPPRVFYNILRDALWRSVTWFDPAASRSRAELAEDCATIFLTGFAANEMPPAS